MNNDQDTIESSVGTESSSKEITDRISNRDDVNFRSDYDYTNTESTNNDLSTDALKLQMYDEIVQRFGPDPQFSEKLRSHGTLERSFSKDQNFPTNISKEKRTNQNGKEGKEWGSRASEGCAFVLKLDCCVGTPSDAVF